MPNPRVPPHDLAAEESLLGAMLLSAAAIDAAEEVGVTATDFYKPAHGFVFDACASLWARGEPVDAVTAADQLRRDGFLDQVGGPPALVALAAGTPAISNAARYAAIVRDFARLRTLLGSAAEVVELAYSLPDDVASALDRAEGLISGADDRRGTDGLLSMEQLLSLGLDRLEQAAAGPLPGVAWPLAGLTQRFGPMEPGNFVVIGARPAMGKTLVAMQTAIAAAQAGVPTVFASLEMSATELFNRLIASQGNSVNVSSLRRGTLDDRGWQEVTAATGALAQLPLATITDPSLTVPRLRAMARTFARKHRASGCGLIVVDYLQLLARPAGERYESRQLEVSEQSRSLKALAGELGWVVVALSQLSRALESRQDKRPILSDLRESGAMEHDADVVMFLYRDEVYNAATQDRGKVELAIAKHRHAEVTGVPVIASFDGAHSRIS